MVVLSGGYVANRVGSYYGLTRWRSCAWKVGESLVAIAFVTLVFFLIYYFAPDLEEQHWYWITPGSVFGVLLWIAASFAFRGYLHFFNTYSRTYGSLGAVMILLMWLYVTGFAFLLGGEINAQIEHAAAKHGHPEGKSTGREKSRLSDMVGSGRDRTDGPLLRHGRGKSDRDLFIAMLSTP